MRPAGIEKMTALIADAAYALLALYAEDMRDAYPALLTPPPDPRLFTDGWTLRGYLTGVDTLLRPKATMANGLTRVYYGYLAEQSSAPGNFVVVVRGTEGFLEWLEDADFSMRNHPIRGKVESGFFGIYTSLQYRPRDSLTELPLISGLTGYRGTGSAFTVIGHSLGAAMAHYLALDLVLAGVTVAGRFFASPHPGDLAFAELMAAYLSDLRAYVYAMDIVPKVPFLMGYTQLPNPVVLDPSNVQAKIRSNVWCNHHAASYASMLNFGSVRALDAPDAPYLGCILGAAS
jgi:triacylglycerol lipase